MTVAAFQVLMSASDLFARSRPEVAGGYAHNRLVGGQLAETRAALPDPAIVQASDR
jgi:hypothetical protein